MNRRDALKLLGILPVAPAVIAKLPTERVIWEWGRPVSDLAIKQIANTRSISKTIDILMSPVIEGTGRWDLELRSDGKGRCSFWAIELRKQTKWERLVYGPVPPPLRVKKLRAEPIY